MSDAHILIVEDEAAVRYLCETLLRKEGYEVALADCAAAAREALARERFDLLVLDLCLPDGDGLELAREVHGRLTLPILMMTARSRPEERLVGFEAGAVDYLVKPFHPGELVFRVRHALRPGQHLPAEQTCWQFNGHVFDPEARTLELEGHDPVSLTRGEADLLAMLLRARGRAVSRDTLLTAVARDEGGHSRTVDVLISRLRRKLGDNSRRPSQIVTLPGVGYRLAQAPAGQARSRETQP